MVESNKIYWADCLDLMPKIESGTIDLILCDLPYGTTACKWDAVLPFDKLWSEYKRLIKPNGAIVLFGSEPFSSYLRMSNIADYKYDWYWNKMLGGNNLIAEYRPLGVIETISVFGKGKINYYPQMRTVDESLIRNNTGISRKKNSDLLSGIKSGNFKHKGEYNHNIRFPINIYEHSRQSGELNSTLRIHPTQKPLALIEYLIKTYTKETELILDNCAGSGTTCLAAKRTGRNYIGIEKDEKYFHLAFNRLNGTLL